MNDKKCSEKFKTDLFLINKTFGIAIIKYEKKSEADII